MRPAVNDKPVLIAKCENEIEQSDFCDGELRFEWGMGQAACDTCGAWCGIAVADWRRIEGGV
jgi:hypothetical protein